MKRYNFFEKIYWGWAEKSLNEGWKQFRESFKNE